MGKYTFFSSCVGWPSNKEDDLHFIVEKERRISYRTFRKNVDATFRDVKRELGYDRRLAYNYGITMAKDWSVSFHKSRLPNRKVVYYFCYSDIEYVFVSPEEK